MSISEIYYNNLLKSQQKKLRKNIYIVAKCGIILKMMAGSP